MMDYQDIGDRLDVFVAVEDTTLHRCVVGVVGERVPGAEVRDRRGPRGDEVADKRRAVVRSRPEADGAHLGERADRPAAATAGVLDASDERRGDGAEADEQDAEAALGRLDRAGHGLDEVFRFQDHSSLAGERHEWHLPLRGHPPGLRPVFDRALPLAEQGGKRALPAEAPDDPLGGVDSFVHGRHHNDFFVILQEVADGAGTTEAPERGSGVMREDATICVHVTRRGMCRPRLQRSRPLAWARCRFCGGCPRRWRSDWAR